MSIEFRSVTKRFDDGTVAVDDFSLTLPAHKTTVLVGSSGCGKTTLLRMVNRLIDPTSGEVLIDGEPVSGRDPVALRRGIGYVLQNAGLLPHFTVLDNIATVPVLSGVPRARAREQALTFMDVVGLERSLADRYPSQLSGGQQQRVGVARALAVEPNILQKGERIAQVGSPSEIIENPADDFVAEFVGTERGARAFTIAQTPRGRVVRDAAGRTQGVLVDDAGMTDAAAPVARGMT